MPHSSVFIGKNYGASSNVGRNGLIKSLHIVYFLPHNIWIERPLAKGWPQRDKQCLCLWSSAFEGRQKTKQPSERRDKANANSVERLAQGSCHLAQFL